MLTELHGAERRMVRAQVYAYHKTMNRCLQDFPYRDNHPCESVPVGKYLQVLALQTFSPHSGRSPLPDRR
jgi:hypothetical protein